MVWHLTRPKFQKSKSYDNSFSLTLHEILTTPQNGPTPYQGTATER